MPTERQNSDSPIIYREYKFPEAFPFLLMIGSTITSELRFIHFHNCIELALCKRGRMLWNLESTCSLVNPGDLCLIPPFFTHASCFPPQESEDVLCFYLFFNPEQLLAPFYPNGFPEDLCWYRYIEFDKILPNGSCPEIASVVDVIVREAIERPENYEKLIRGLIEYLMVCLYRRHRNSPAITGRGNGIPQLFPAVSQIMQQYDKELNTAELAALCGLSQAQFEMKFRECFHQTPRQYLRFTQIRRACRLLTSTEDGILEIALQAGFQSLSSFNRAFREIMGETPQAFRNRQRTISKRDWKHALYIAENN